MDQNCDTFHATIMHQDDQLGEILIGVMPLNIHFSDWMLGVLAASRHDGQKKSERERSRKITINSYVKTSFKTKTIFIACLISLKDGMFCSLDK